MANLAEAVNTISRPVKVETERLTLTSPVKKQRLGKSFIAFDVETTGLDPQADRIIELGAVRFVDGVPVDSFSTLVNPNKRIPASATAVNHITNDMIIDAPNERSAFTAFLKYLDRAVVGSEIICAHNASFDFGFLENTLKRLGYSAQLKYVDTLTLSRKYIKGLPSYKLGIIADCLNIQNRAAHRAAGDAEVCGKILIEILDSHSESGSYKEYFSNETFDKGKEMSQEELETCAVIQNIIKNAGCDVKGLRFRKNSSGYIDISERGEEKRKNGELMEAIELFDMARYHGYCYPALYESYAITYQKLNDLDNVIVIMEEALSREPYGKNGKFLARRDKAIQQLYKKQDKERKKEEKNKKKTEQKQKDMSLRLKQQREELLCS